jgi:hypothetical protein
MSEPRRQENLQAQGFRPVAAQGTDTRRFAHQGCTERGRWAGRRRSRRRIDQAADCACWTGKERRLSQRERGERAVFFFGFAKNERSNIDGEELQEFKRLALVFLELNAKQIATLIDDNELMEVRDDKAD